MKTPGNYQALFMIYDKHKHMDIPLGFNGFPDLSLDFGYELLPSKDMYAPKHTPYLDIKLNGLVYRAPLIEVISEESLSYVGIQLEASRMSPLGPGIVPVTN